MIAYLGRTISLSNLRCAGRSGQVATILVFLMVVLLVFIMATMNIGHLAVTTTNLANAVDAASLYLASQLSTRSKAMFEALGTGKLYYCKKRGLLAFIFSWVGAVIGQALCGPPCAVAGGTIGGGVGGAIDGSGFEQGLTTGFQIGMSFMGAMSMGGGIESAFSGGGFAEGAWSAGTTFSSSMSSTQGIMQGINLAASIYNFYQKDKDLKKGMREIAKAMNGLDLKVQLRESTYLSVLSQVVNDPNLVPDKLDIDLDDDRGELVDEFQQRWFERTLWLADKVGNLKEEIIWFNSDDEDKEGRWSLGKFRNFADDCVSAGNPKNYLSRAEFTYQDGSLVSLARILEAKFNKDVSFWKPGTPEPYSRQTVTEEWDRKRKIHDPLDRVTAEFLSLIAIADEMNGMIEKNSELNRLAEQWIDWIGVFYYLPGDLDKLIGPDPEAGTEKGGYYFVLGYLVGCRKDPGVDDCASDFSSLKQWKENLEAIRDELRGLKNCKRCISGCCLDEATGKCSGKCDDDSEDVCNPDCKLSHGTEFDYYYDKTGHISDSDFNKAINDIDEIIEKIGKFKEGILRLYNNLKSVTLVCSSSTIPLGVDPVVYDWTDSAGEHSVAVRARFPMPYIKYTSDWEEVCLKLRNAWGTVTVEATRTDPSNVQIGILGKWNPFSGNVTRVSKSEYTYDRTVVPKMSGIK